MNHDDLFNILSVVVLGLPFIDWTASVILLRAVRRRPDLVTLRDRLGLAAGIAMLSTVFAVLALSRLGHVSLPADFVGLLLAGVVIFLSMVNLGFVIRYWTTAWGVQ